MRSGLIYDETKYELISERISNGFKVTSYRRKLPSDAKKDPNNKTSQSLLRKSLMYHVAKLG